MATTSRAAAAATLALALFPAAAFARPDPVYVDVAAKRPAPQLLGVWREVGSGRLIVIGPDGFDLYHTTRILCYRDPAGVRLALDSRYARFETRHRGRELRLFFHDLGANTARYQNHERFTRLARLPEGCVSSLERADTTAPSFIFDLFWQTFADHYAFFAERGIDWNDVRRTYRPRVTPQMSHDELFELFAEILGKINDGHVHLYLGTQRHFQAGTNVVRERLQRAFEAQATEPDLRSFIARWAASLRQTIAEGFLAEPVHKAANDNIWWGSIDPDIGYVNVYLLTNFIDGGDWQSRARQLEVVDATFDEIFAAFAGKSAILLDLTHNQGGFDAATDLIVGRFADKTRHVLTTRLHGVPAGSARRVYAHPSQRTRFSKRVYVLTSPVTVSAGEGLVAMLKGLPNVRHLGESTRGYLSGILNKPLPAQFMVSVTSKRLTTPRGELLEVRGVVPETPIDVFPANDVSGGYRRALDTAVRYIRSDLGVSRSALD